MDEDAKSNEIMTSETLSRLVVVIASASATPSRLASSGSDDVSFEWSHIDLALDVLSGLLHDVSPEFLEKATDSLLGLDAHLALAALLE
jgi:hypothetical protein